MLEVMHVMNQEAIQQSQPCVCCLCNKPINICSNEAYCDDCGDQIYNDMNQDIFRFMYKETYERI